MNDYEKIAKLNDHEAKTKQMLPWREKKMGALKKI